MKYIIKAIFIEICENNLIDYNDNIIDHLTNAYINVKSCYDIRIINGDTISAESKLDCDANGVYIIPNEVYNQFKSLKRLCKVSSLSTDDENEIECLVLDYFFSSEYRTIVDKL